MKNFIKMSYLDFKGHLGPFNIEEFATLKTLYPFITMVFYCILAGYAYNTSDVTQWIVGNSFLLCTNEFIFTLGISFTGERYNGRIRSIICSPIWKIKFMIQKGFFVCLSCIVTSLFGTFLGVLVFQVPVHNISWGIYILILLVAMTAACALGIFIGSLGLFTDQILMILNTASYIMLIFTGANFPVSQLPLIGRAISFLLPLTRSIKATRILIHDGEMNQIIHLLIEEFIVGIFYFALASLTIYIVERRAVKKASLELF